MIFFIILLSPFPEEREKKQSAFGGEELTLVHCAFILDRINPS